MALRVREQTLTVDELIKQVKGYTPSAETELIREAYDFSSKAHEGQKRESGEPYLHHPLRVAEIITHLKLDVPSIAAGLLHDTMEDTGLSMADLEKKFGKEIAHLVDVRHYLAREIGIEPSNPVAALLEHARGTIWCDNVRMRARFPASARNVSHRPNCHSEERARLRGHAVA